MWGKRPPGGPQRWVWARFDGRPVSGGPPLAGRTGGLGCGLEWKGRQPCPGAACRAGVVSVLAPAAAGRTPLPAPDCRPAGYRSAGPDRDIAGAGDGASRPRRGGVAMVRPRITSSVPAHMISVGHCPQLFGARLGRHDERCIQHRLAALDLRDQLLNQPLDLMQHRCRPSGLFKV